MKNNKLTELLKIIAPKELKGLRKAILSPIFNTNNNLLIFFDKIIKYYPHFNLSEKDKKSLFSAVYPNEAYQDIKLRYLFSGLVKVVDHYIIYLQSNENAHSKERLKTDFFNNRKQFKHFAKGIEKQHELLDEMPMRNMNYWAEKMRLYNQLYTNPQHNNYDKTDKTPEYLMDASDRFFAFAKVRCGLVVRSKQKLFKADYSLLFMDDLSKEHENGFLAENNLFKIYHSAIKLTDKPEEKNFFEYEEFFFENVKVLHGEDRLFLFHLGLNYIIRQSNSGNTKFQIRALSWYKFAIEERILIVNDTLSKVAFSNIIHFGCKAKEIEWTLDFIQSHVKYLPLEIREDELTYSNAVVYFSQKKFNEVIMNIAEYSFNQAYILKTKSLLIRSYFELFLLDDNYYQILESSLNSHEIYLRRNKFWIERLKTPELNFCKILKKLVKKIRKREKRKEIEKWFQNEIEKNYPLAAKSWLSSKLIKT